MLLCDSRRFDEAEQFALRETEIDPSPVHLAVLEAVRHRRQEFLNASGDEEEKEGYTEEDESNVRACIKNFPADGEPSELGKLFDTLGDILTEFGADTGMEEVWREGIKHASTYPDCYRSLADNLRSGRS